MLFAARVPARAHAGDLAHRERGVRAPLPAPGSRAAGMREPRGGSVAVIQRFGGGARLNPHLHTAHLDGAYGIDASGVERFFTAPAPSAEEVEEILTRIVARVSAVLERRGGESDLRAPPRREGSVRVSSARWPMAFHRDYSRCSAWPGCAGGRACAEPRAIIVYEAGTGTTATGGTLATATIRGPSSGTAPAHGRPFPPCVGCRPEMDARGIRWSGDAVADVPLPAGIRAIASSAVTGAGVASSVESSGDHD